MTVFFATADAWTSAVTVPSHRGPYLLSLGARITTTIRRHAWLRRDGLFEFA